jgi:hypothetical protein
MPKANLRPVPGSPRFQDFECSICKTRFSFKGEVADPKAVAVLKAAIFREWDAHLYNAHRRQWNFQQEKKAKRENASEVKGTEK